MPDYSSTVQNVPYRHAGFPAYHISLYINNKKRITMGKIICMLLLLIPFSAKADTIPVNRARQQPPVVVYPPYKTDSLSMKGTGYDIKDVLKTNDGFALRPVAAETDISAKSALLPETPTDSTTHYLTALRFTVSASRFAKARLQVRNIRNYKTYVDGKETSDAELQLLPGTTEVALLCLTRPTDRDTFDISLTGKSLDGVRVNPTGKRPYTMGDMLQGDHYRSVAMSPTGRYMVTGYYETRKDGSNLYRTVVTEVSTGKTVLRPNEYVALSWMPCRDILYYKRKGSDGQQLVTFDPQNGEEKILSAALPDGNFTMSPTEEFLIFSRTQEGRSSQNGLKRLEEPDDRQPGWRNRSALSLYDLKSGVMRPLTFGEASVRLNDISLDGTKLLLSYSRMDLRRMPFSRTTVVAMDVRTQKVDTLLADTIGIAGVQFSPDATRLLVKASPEAFDGIGSELSEEQHASAFDYRLYLYDIARRETRPLLCGFRPSVGNTVWAYGDNHIYFSATDGCDVRLFRLSPNTGEVVRYDLPVTYIQGFSISVASRRHPQAAFFGQTGERAREMFVCELSDVRPKARRVGEIDFDKMYADVAIGTCRNWNFMSSRGDSISGFYFLPPDFDASRKYPLIVYYYGGCTPTGKTLEFQYPLQVLAGQGYVVYVCEPSGTIGYGQEFASRHVNTWGIGSADDIIEGTQQFIREHPYVDSTKVGCMGASYGGFMTQYLQTRTDLFAAAVSHAGISNIASYWGGGYWGYTYGEVAQYGSYPWNNPDLYVKQSPLFSADKIHTPLLLLHGTADTNVPTTESQQLFTALRILGRPVSYVQVDGENHVIVDYKKRLAWQNVIFAWFAHWLKEQPEWWHTLYPEDDFGQSAAALR